MTTVILIELAVALAAGLAFIVFYAARSEWRTSVMGRHMMVFVVATTIEIGSLLALGMGVRVPIPAFVVIFGLVDVAMVQRLILLLQAQRRGTINSTSPYRGDVMGKYAKAVVAAIVAGLGVVLTGLDDNSVSGQEWLSALVAFLGALGVVWAVPNKPEVPNHRYPHS